MARPKIVVTCEVCKQEFEKEVRRIKQAEKNNQVHTCSRKCSSQISNTRRMAPPTSRNAKNTRTDKMKYPEKDKARYLVRLAIKTGKLIPLKNCEYCGIEKKLEAHHPDHSFPYLLVWLCKDCHALFDKHKLFGYGKDYSKEIENS